MSVNREKDTLKMVGPQYPRMWNPWVQEPR